MVLAVCALLVALSGSSWAARLLTGADVRNNSLTGADIRNRSLTGADVRDRSLTGADVAPGSLTPGHVRGSFTGPAGPTGAQGAAGARGADGAAGAQGAEGQRGADAVADTSTLYSRTASDARFERRYARTIVVRSDGTPAQNAERVVDALGDVAPASVAEAVLVRLEPGDYDFGTGELQLEPFVDVEGAGIGVTRLQGTAIAVVDGASDTEIRDVSILSPDSAVEGSGIRVNGTRMSVRDVAIDVREGTNIYGILQDANHSARLVDVVIRVDGGIGGATARGILALGTIDAFGVDIEVTGGSFLNFGVDVSGGTIRFQNGRSVATDASPRSLNAASNGALRVATSGLTGTTDFATGGTVTCFGTYDASTFLAVACV